jgi:taurine dioxygenase
MNSPHFSVRELTVGAEIVGLQYANAYDEAARQALYDTWLTYGVLVFRGITSVEQHLNLSRCFGELEPHPIVSRRSKEHPLMLELGGPRSVRAMVYDDMMRINRVGWHRDTAYTPAIAKGAMLRLLELPPTEGETMFADSARAYDDLPSALQERLEKLEYRALLRTGPIDGARHGAFWAYSRWATPQEDPEGAEPASARTADLFPPVVHPAVLVHPESERKCIFLSPKDFDYFLGMDRGESDALMDYLVSHLCQPKYVYRHDWRKNDAVLWDNRRMLHAAAGNRVDHPRWGLRTTLAGSFRAGRYFDKAPDIVAPPTMD